MTKRYYFGPGDDEPMIEDTGGALNCSGTKFLHTNPQGSIVALAGANFPSFPATSNQASGLSSDDARPPPT